eukprot:4986047-Prymnesium_polylepis.2
MARGKEDEDWRVGGTGYLEGWRGQYEAMMSRVECDGEGYLCWCGDEVEEEDGSVTRWDGERVTEQELEGKDVAWQMVGRARLALGDVPVVGGKPAKRKDTHVNRDVAASNLRELCVWSARVRATAVFASDGSRKTVKEKDGERSVRVARAVVRHDGRVVGGRMAASENNYKAELAAVLDALEEEEAGGRLIFVMDATSPIRAAL